MPASRSLTMLLRIRCAAEDESRRVMEIATGELQRLRDSLQSAQKRELAGRAHAAAGVISGDATDRIAGQEEIRIAEHLGALLIERIDRAERQVAALREDFLHKRMERRQVEMLLASLQQREAEQTHRSEQSDLDEWHRQNSRDRGTQRTQKERRPQKRGEA